MKNKKIKTEKSEFEQLLEHTATHQSDVISIDHEKTWKRPPITPFDPVVDSIIFQQIEIDEHESNIVSGLSNPYNLKSSSTLRMYGVNKNGNSLLCHVHGFLPYFYAAAPHGLMEENVEDFREALDSLIRGENKRFQTSSSPTVVKIELCQKKSIFGYRGTEDRLFLRIFTHLPNHIAPARRHLEKGIRIPIIGDIVCNPTYESNIQYLLRFMIDCGIVGCNWIEIPGQKYKLRKNKYIETLPSVINNPFCFSSETSSSTCQLELDVHYSDLISHPPEGEWSNVAPLRVLSYDIECTGRKGVFPDPKIDPCIQIANIVTIQGQSKPFVRNVFTLDTCANIAGTHILSFQKESDLLIKWREFIEEVDPDMIIGYNITNFDFPYLLDRSEALSVEEFPFLGRIKDVRTNAKDTRFSSKAHGTRDSKTINLDGRLQMDILQVMQRDFKLRSYTLNSVSAHFLGEQKEDVHHSIISDLQNGNEETRRRLAVYCLKDAYLPQRLMDKLMCVYNYMEMARVTGVPFNYLLTRGQQIKVVSQLYRKAMTEGLLVPALHIEGNDEQFEGATVIEPEKGYYNVPIATLDFTSLYPSIMMAHNLCYSTYIESKKMADNMGLVLGVDYVLTPNNDYFVVPSVKKGLLPIILEDLLTARKKAKNDLKKESDPFKKAVLDGRQLALKISANSVYGFTGATIGKLPLLAISSSTTAYGREMIEKTKQLVEAKYTIANGFQHDAHVIYGDTDSVMVKFGTTDLAETMALGSEAARYVTSHFIKPINLDFEKIYYPYLLISKKRYAGLYWTNSDTYDKLDAKGIETVRRDNCRLVSNVIDTSLRKLLIDRDVDGAQEFVKKMISDLLQNKVDLSQLVISKALSKTEYSGKQAHAELADRMKKRDAGSAPSLGDRVNYVIIKGAKNAAAYEKAEDPLYVLEHNLPIDTKYYLENQLSKPLLRIFEPILGETKAQSLLSGEHTRTVIIAAPTTGGLMKFAKKTASCLGCKVPLNQGESALCKHCQPHTYEHFNKNMDQLNAYEEQYSKLWTQCQRCSGSLHQDVICTSQDCPIFYMRKRAQKDMKDISEIMERFNYQW